MQIFTLKCTRRIVQVAVGTARLQKAAEVNVSVVQWRIEYRLLGRGAVRVLFEGTFRRNVSPQS
jgi:hypothetical protein